MARYQYANTDKSAVIDSANGAIIPVTPGAGGPQGDAYRAWVVAGNVTDTYVMPVVSTPVNQVMPISYTVSTAPAASSMPNAIITITDLPEGSRNCWSDGANWRRISDDTIVV